MSTLVQDFLQDSAARQPDKTALVWHAQKFTYRELDNAANRMARALLKLGVTRGDRVVLYLNNSAELVIGIFGVLKAGGTFIVTNRGAKAEKLVHILKSSRASVLVTDDRALDSRLRERLAEEVRGLRLVVCSTRGDQGGPETDEILDFQRIQNQFPASRPRSSTIDLDLACLIYTSSTTGEPKGVMCDHGNVVFVARTIVEYLKNDSEDVILNVLPLASSYGLYQLMCAFLAGSTLVLEESFAFPVQILQTMVRERVTGFAGVPTMYSILLNMDMEAFDLSRLRYMTNAGAGLPIEHVKRLRKVFPDAKLFLMHGLTEVARTMYLPPDQVEVRPDSSGKALAGTELWLENEAGQRLGPNQVGELVVRGRHVMRGYWEDPARTTRRFRPGWIPGERLCYSGDLFRTDEEGFFYFVSRTDDIIKCGGEKVAPRAVEDVLYEIAGVKEATVIGVPHPVLGQAVKAFIVAPGATLTAGDVIAHCKSRLESIMVPHDVEFRSELPKTDSGKIRKRGLS